MKICAIICEFNPFHNGHKYLLERAKEASGCDAVLCLMSGSFTQRGEIAVMDKYDRAKHAVLGGADCVLELPVAFSVAPAEIFASGAVKILSALGADTLAFGCEELTDFSAVAKTLCTESDVFKDELQKNLAAGESYIKSYAAAYEKVGGDKEILSKPNNVLAVEYAKAILREGNKIKLLPVKRVGSSHGDDRPAGNFSSSTAIRRNLTSPQIKDSLPPYVYNDLDKAATGEDNFICAMQDKLFWSDAENLKRVYGCGEGLENKLLSLSSLPFDKIIEGATSKRYSASRIRRILCANMLNIYADDCRKYLSNDLFVKALAIKKNRAEEILSYLSLSHGVTTVTKYGAEIADGVAAECFEKDKKSYEIWRYLNRLGKPVNDSMKLI